MYWAAGVVGPLVDLVGLSWLTLASDLDRFGTEAESGRVTVRCNADTWPFGGYGRTEKLRFWRRS